MPLISVIIPIYNSEKHLEECLESVLRQSYKNLEIILIDDGSVDGSKEICDRYAECDKRVVAIHQENRGVSYARNVGMATARGDFIGFVDADDILNEDLYNTLYHNLVNYDADISICETSFVSEKNNIAQKFSVEPINKFQVLQSILLEDRIRGYLYNKLFKRDLCIQTTIREDLNICEDLYYLCEIIKNDTKIVYDTQNLYYVRESQGSLTRTLDNLFNERGNLKYIEVLDEISNTFFATNSNIKSMIKIHQGRLTIGVLQQLYDLNDKNMDRKCYLKKAFKQYKPIIVKSTKIKQKEKFSMLLTYYSPIVKKMLKKVM